MTDVVNLSQRPLYGFSQVDRLLKLPGGTAARWVDGYDRGGKSYDPVIRPERTGDPIATWGEFVETRLLSEFRDQGVPLLRMRPAIQALRDELQTPYPLASARTWLGVEGKELVRAVQEDVGLERRLRLVEVRTGQVLWSARAESFLDAVEWGDDGTAALVRPADDITEVIISPARGFGEPVVRGVRTEIIAELVNAGEATAAIAEMYELEQSQVEDALRYELRRAA